ncbi:MAG: DUF2384 domain-containing protein [Nitrospinae bacterium]|nr:DUF2384 domain-containing protein [Nitrospinota bacterium]
MAIPLGGKGRPGGEPRSEIDRVIVEVKEGLPFKAFENIQKLLNLDTYTMARMLDISKRTIDRRKSGKQRFAPGESDRLARLGRIIALAEDVLEDRENAIEWLHDPNPALSWERPLNLLDTELGTKKVEDVLMRIEHGIYG